MFGCGWDSNVIALFVVIPQVRKRAKDYNDYATDDYTTKRWKGLKEFTAETENKRGKMKRKKLPKRIARSFARSFARRTAPGLKTRKTNSNSKQIL